MSKERVLGQHGLRRAIFKAHMIPLERLNMLSIDFTRLSEGIRWESVSFLSPFPPLSTTSDHSGQAVRIGETQPKQDCVYISHEGCDVTSAVTHLRWHSCVSFCRLPGVSTCLVFVLQYEGKGWRFKGHWDFTVVAAWEERAGLCDNIGERDTQETQVFLESGRESRHVCSALNVCCRSSVITLVAWHIQGKGWMIPAGIRKFLKLSNLFRDCRRERNVCLTGSVTNTSERHG